MIIQNGQKESDIFCQSVDHTVVGKWVKCDCEHEKKEIQDQKKVQKDKRFKTQCSPLIIIIIPKSKKTWNSELALMLVAGWFLSNLSKLIHYEHGTNPGCRY